MCFFQQIWGGGVELVLWTGWSAIYGFLRLFWLVRINNGFLELINKGTTIAKIKVMQKFSGIQFNSTWFHVQDIPFLSVDRKLLYRKPCSFYFSTGWATSLCNRGRDTTPSDLLLYYQYHTLLCIPSLVIFITFSMFFKVLSKILTATHRVSISGNAG